MKIYKNLWASYDCYFICSNSDKKYHYGYLIWKPKNEWEFCPSQFYNSDIKDTGHFPVVGNIDLNSIIVDAVLNIVNKGVEDNA
jgi:hypothetical protein